MMKLLGVRNVSTWSRFPDFVLGWLESKGFEVRACPCRCNKVKDAIHTFKPTIILWFRLPPLSPALMERVKAEGKMTFILYNWDSSHRFWEASHVKDLLPFMDHVFTCNKGEPFTYLLPSAIPIPSPIPLHFSKPFDISIAATSTYEELEKYDSRVAIFDALEADRSIRFGLFGPPWMHTRWKASYQGTLAYVDMETLILSSTLCLTLHGTKNEGYLNERTMIILAYGGALVIEDMESSREYFSHGENALIFGSTGGTREVDSIESLLDLVKEWKRKDLSSLRSNGKALFESKWSWDRWINTFSKCLQEF